MATHTHFYRALLREYRFALRSKALVLWFFITLVLSFTAIALGMLEVAKQRATLNTLIQADQQERETQLTTMKDWGSTAYYTFHLTYEAPTNFAFAALGLRDSQPWQHRIRMLALEGQIYERDVANPVIATLGRFDFTFLVTFLIPLIIAVLIYDLKAQERTAGRFNLLEATTTHPKTLWLTRLSARVSLIIGALITPFIAACWVAQVDGLVITQAVLWVAGYCIFWATVGFWCATWQHNSTRILMGFLALWLAWVIVLPASTRSLINRSIPIVAGADILLLQRETVNGAWDLPREATFAVFFEHHPQWQDYTPPTQGFEWQWYYAFQRVGDIKTAQLAQQHQQGVLKRDQVAGWAALFLPSVFFERHMQALAQTNTQAAMAYQQTVREFHKTLQNYYYPKFFNKAPFEQAALNSMPLFGQPPLDNSLVVQPR